MDYFSIDPVYTKLITQLRNEPIRADIPGITDGQDSFADILTESLKTAAATDTADKFSGVQLLTGQSDDMSGLLLDASKAEISLSLALQIRNKVIDAYNEIMRMSV